MPDYQGIRYSYAETANELLRIKRIAAPFLEHGSDRVLDQCAVDLTNIRNADPRRSHTWQIGKDWSVKTRESEDYKRGGKGGIKPVYGELQFVWEIENPNKARRQQSHFHLKGIASTSLFIRSADEKDKAEDESDIVARWQFEAGDATSPGCHFHAGVNQYGKDGRFPEWLKVPRFPGLLLSPMDGLEYLLGELFHDEWLRVLSPNSEDRNSWGKSQRNRLERVLQWQMKQVVNWNTSPWMSLKTAKPELEVICSD
jgi:hypothetical protein